MRAAIHAHLGATLQETAPLPGQASWTQLLTLINTSNYFPGKPSGLREPQILLLQPCLRVERWINLGVALPIVHLGSHSGPSITLAPLRPHPPTGSSYGTYFPSLTVGTWHGVSHSLSCFGHNHPDGTVPIGLHGSFSFIWHPNS